MSGRTVGVLGIALAISCLAAPRPLAAAGGLRCSLGEVVVENLQLGRTYSLKSLANLPLALTNTGDRPVRVAVVSLVPDSGELRLGAEAVPNAAEAWATPETLSIGAGATRTVELMLSIPDDTKRLGRKYEVLFWSHSLAEPGEMLAFGLKSRVIFSVDPVRSSASDPNPTGDLSVRLEPAEVKLGRLAPGRKISLEAAALTVRNTSDRRVNVELSALGLAEAGVVLPDSWGDLTRAGTVRLDPRTITLEPGQERVVAGTVSLPRDKGLKGKTLVCVIAAAVTGQAVRTRIYSRLYVDVR